MAGLKLLRKLGKRFGWAEPLFASTRHRWNRLSPFVRHLAKSLLIGIGVELFLYFTHPFLPGITTAETAATDWAIQFWQDRSVDPDVQPERFVFVDIDEVTYQMWGEPLATPREKLLRIVQFAVEAQAKIMVVDVELTKRMQQDPDQALLTYLKTYSDTTARTSQTPGPHPASPTHIILVRTIGPPLRPTPSDSRLNLDEKELRKETTARDERPSEFLEPVVSQSLVLHWASALINRDPDGVLRSWRLFESTCLNQESNGLPSVALLAWALVRQPHLDGASFSVRRFGDELRGRVSASSARCAHGGRLPALSSDKRPDGGWRLYDPVLKKFIHLSVKPTDLEQRIFYRYKASSVQPAFFSRVGASMITDPPAEHPLSHDWLSGKIVIVGSSHEAGRDLHATPLGEMPGGVVIINQINALLEYGQIQELAPKVKWVILLPLIVAFSLSFSYFTVIWGGRVARVLVNVILVPLSLWLFQYGWWLDIVLPLVAIQGHQMVAEFRIEPQKIRQEHVHTNHGK